jgi:high-affinity iron transporter
MFLNTVVFVLHELLEAALLLSLLLVLNRLLNRYSTEQLVISLWWVPIAIVIGLAGAWLFAHFYSQVSEWFDYVGFEVTNAFIQILIMLALILFCYMFSIRARLQATATLAWLAPLLMIVMLALGIAREVSEIILYLDGVLAVPENISPAILGTIMATGIGISSGIVLYYVLEAMPVSWRFRLCMVMLALFAGNTASQATVLLIQADWLPYTGQAWDSAQLLPEQFVIGQILYILIGYEANPSVLQMSLYAVFTLVVVFSPLALLAWRGASAASEGAE